MSAPQERDGDQRRGEGAEHHGESFAERHAGDFFIGASTCRGPLPAGETCTLWVRFAPQGVGARDAALVLATNATPASYRVDLSGVGGALPQGEPGHAGRAGH